MEKLGIFGGTFNPPHLGHRVAAERFAEEVGLDRLLVIPDYLPPHKDLSGGASETDRLAMCRLNFAGIPALEVSDLEIKRGGRSFTYETVESLASPDRELYLLVGTDMFLSFDRWRMPDRILAKATLVCMQREDDDDLYRRIREQKRLLEDKFGAKIILLSSKALEASSTSVRECLKEGEKVPTLRDTVAEYIREKGLYR